MWKAGAMCFEQIEWIICRGIDATSTRLGDGGRGSRGVGRGDQATVSASETISIWPVGLFSCHCHRHYRNLSQYTCIVLFGSSASSPLVRIIGGSSVCSLEMRRYLTLCKYILCLVCRIHMIWRHLTLCIYCDVCRLSVIWLTSFDALQQN